MKWDQIGYFVLDTFYFIWHMELTSGQMQVDYIDPKLLK